MALFPLLDWTQNPGKAVAVKARYRPITGLLPSALGFEDTTISGAAAGYGSGGGVPTRSGVEVNFGANSCLTRSVPSVQLAAPTGITLVGRFRVFSTGSQNLSSLDDGAGASLVRLQSAGAGAVSLAVAISGGTGRSVLLGAGVSAAASFTVVAVIRPDKIPVLYVRGPNGKVFRGTAAAYAGSPSDLTRVTYGGQNGAGASTTTEAIEMAQWLGVAVSEGEAWSLLANPWQIFEPRLRFPLAPPLATPILGSLDKTLDDATLSADSTISANSGTDGTLTRTLDDATLSATGALAIAGATTGPTPTVASDNFNRGDGTLGANWPPRWSSAPGSTSAVITSNQVDLSIFGAEIRGWAGTGTFAADQEAAHTPVHTASANSLTGPAVRLGGVSTLAVATGTGYFAKVAGTGTASIEKLDGAGSYSQLAQTAGTYVVVSGVTRLALRAVGEIISLYFDGALILQVRDATYASGVPGWFIQKASLGGASPGLDDWSATDIVPVGRLLEPATLVATGARYTDGALDKTLDDATLAATGALDIIGALGKTLDDASLAATGALDISAGLDKTLDDASLTATGVLVLGEMLAITGSLSVTLDDATLSATGVVASTPPDSLGSMFVGPKRRRTEDVVTDDDDDVLIFVI